MIIRVEVTVEEYLSPEQAKQYQEILRALIKSGGGTGVKNGQTILHFDNEGVFKGIQLSYWPYRRRG